MPAARGLKRTASKASASGSGPPKIKKKHGVQLEIPTASKVKGRLLTCGQGDVGQLGLGEDITEALRFKFVSTLGDKIVDACAGGMHTVALDSDGKVWTFGCNDEGALGRETSGDGDEFTPAVVSLPSEAVAVSAGDSHTAALLTNGDVYLWGSFRDSHGTMGLVVQGREGKTCKEPVRVPLTEHAAAIASGGDHLLILTVTGALYTAGCGEQGQLGRLSERSASRHARQGLGALLVPAVVTLKQAVKHVWGGYHATFAVDANNKMLACGLNNYSQLGITKASMKKPVFSLAEADSFTAVANDNDQEVAWEQVTPGQHHTLATDSAGACYAIGRCEYGRLGLGDNNAEGDGSKDAESLTLIPALSDKKCVSIAAGTSSSYAVTDKGELYAWGMGSEGQLGTGKEEDQPTPCLITGSAFAQHKCVKVWAGGQHTVVLATNVNEGADREAVPAVSSSSSQKVAASEPKGRAAKKQQKEDSEITSTNSDEAMEVDTKVEKKLNEGKEEHAPMETDETDKSDDTPKENATKTESTETIKKSEPKTTEDKVDTATIETVNDVTETINNATKTVNDATGTVNEATEKINNATERETLNDTPKTESVSDASKTDATMTDATDSDAPNLNDETSNKDNAEKNKSTEVLSQNDIKMVEAKVNGNGDVPKNTLKITEKALPNAEVTAVATESATL